ncbi:hypothetical protein WISP_136022 [Willisornis vidua]|uniref:Uncharacterized protein n=1 Tax=Willisornis vidua TaxID=1566151 RepID=A0ABQ9CRA3_9PASS|nr:hypothetical protein WISP_136022 [Willisornis vidua]
MLQPQDSQESQTSVVVEKEVDLEPYRVIRQRKVSQRSVKDEGWKLVTACTRRKVPPPSQSLTGRTGAFYKRYEALELEDQKTDEECEGPSGVVVPPKTIPPEPCIKTSFVKRKKTRVNLLRKVKIGGCLCNSNHEAIEFKISVKRCKNASKISALDMG